MTTKQADALQWLYALIIFILLLIGAILDTEHLEKDKEVTETNDIYYLEETFLNDSIIIFN